MAYLKLDYFQDKQLQIANILPYSACEHQEGCGAIGQDLVIRRSRCCHSKSPSLSAHVGRRPMSAVGPCRPSVVPVSIGLHSSKLSTFSAKLKRPSLSANVSRPSSWHSMLHATRSPSLTLRGRFEGPLSSIVRVLQESYKIRFMIAFNSETFRMKISSRIVLHSVDFDSGIFRRRKQAKVSVAIRINTAVHDSCIGLKILEVLFEALRFRDRICLDA